MALLVILGVVMVTIMSAVLNGLVFSVLWGWFIVPTLSLPSISIAQAIGIGLIINYLTYHPVDCKPSDKEGGEKLLIDTLSFLIARPLTVLALGWIVHLFM